MNIPLQIKSFYSSNLLIIPSIKFDEDEIDFFVHSRNWTRRGRCSLIRLMGIREARCIGALLELALIS